MNISQMRVGDIPAGAVIVYDDKLFKVKDVRRHAMTEIDNTAWVILEGWKDHTHYDPPKLDVDLLMLVVTA